MQVSTDQLPDYKYIRALWFAFNMPEVGHHHATLDACKDPLIREVYQAIQTRQDGGMKRLDEVNGLAAWVMDHVLDYAPPSERQEALWEKQRQRVAAGLPELFFGETAVMQLPDLDPGTGSWLAEPPHACRKTNSKGEEVTGAAIVIRKRRVTISPMMTPAWRDNEDRPGCRGCQHARAKREARKVLWELARLDGRLWGVWMPNETDYKRFVARTHKRRQRHGIEGSYTAYPTSDGRFYVIHDQEGEGGQAIPGDRAELFRLLHPIANDTPDDRRISTSGGWGGPWQGARGDGRAKQAKRAGVDDSILFRGWLKRSPQEVAEGLVKTSDSTKSYSIRTTPDRFLLHLAERGETIYCCESNEQGLTDLVNCYPGLDIAVEEGRLLLISEGMGAVEERVRDNAQSLQNPEEDWALSRTPPAVDPPKTAVEEASPLRLDLLQASFGGLR